MQQTDTPGEQQQKEESQPIQDINNNTTHNLSTDDSLLLQEDAIRQPVIKQSKIIETDNQNNEADNLAAQQTSSDIEQEGKKQRLKIWKERGNTAFKEGRLEEAIKNYELAVKEFKQLLVMNKISEQDDVISYIWNIEVLEIDQNNVKSLFRRAQSYIKIGKDEQANIDLRTAYEIDPKNADVRATIQRQKEKDLHQKSIEKQISTKMLAGLNEEERFEQINSQNKTKNTFANQVFRKAKDVENTLVNYTFDKAVSVFKIPQSILHSLWVLFIKLLSSIFYHFYVVILLIVNHLCERIFKRRIPAFWFKKKS